MVDLSQCEKERRIGPPISKKARAIIHACQALDAIVDACVTANGTRTYRDIILSGRKS